MTRAPDDGEHEGRAGWCEVLDVDVPNLEAVRSHREAKPFSLLLVALLERGAPMTLDEVLRGVDDSGSLRRAPFAQGSWC